ncbi:MAG: hypothetical protein AB1503_11060 [Bacillota bacterium]
MAERFRLPSEIPLEEWPAPSEFVQESLDCIGKARDKRIHLRVMGGLAIFIHSQEFMDLWKQMERLGKKVFTDIDYVSYGKYRAEVMDLFRERGFLVNQKILYLYGKDRHVYYGSRIPMAEVFFDKLAMNHTIDFRGRLEADYPTIPVAELLLQKIQMVRMNEKDVKDAIVLLRAHPVGTDDTDKINKVAVAAPLLKDWGFYYTATTNLKRIEDSLGNYTALSNEDRKIVASRVRELLTYVESQPKSLNWKARSIIGPKLKWYNEVDEWDVIESASDVPRDETK